MADVDAAQVAQLVDSSDTPTDRALAVSDVAISVVTRFARSYTRGRGFDQFGSDEDIAAVITTASARLAANSAQTVTSQSIDDATREVRSAFDCWTLAELAVLNRYRRRAM